jgi:hypothetical protein
MPLSLLLGLWYDAMENMKRTVMDNKMSRRRNGSWSRKEE